MTRDQLKNRIRGLVKQVYTVNKITPEEAAQYDELTKFPELKKVIVDLLTNEYDNFLDSIDWVSPRPTTFRINLKNGQDFYLIYGKRSWIAQVEGKKYYLESLVDQQRASEALSRVLRYTKPEATEEKTEVTPPEPPASKETPATPEEPELETPPESPAA